MGLRCGGWWWSGNIEIWMQGNDAASSAPCPHLGFFVSAASHHLPCRRRCDNVAALWMDGCLAVPCLVFVSLRVCLSLCCAAGRADILASGVWSFFFLGGRGWVVLMRASCRPSSLPSPPSPTSTAAPSLSPPSSTYPLSIQCRDRFSSSPSSPRRPISRNSTVGKMSRKLPD